jgi:hypothetical protein
MDASREERCRTVAQPAAIVHERPIVTVRSDPMLRLWRGAIGPTSAGCNAFKHPPHSAPWRSCWRGSPSTSACRLGFAVVVTGKCRSHAERDPALVQAAKALSAQRPRSSLRKIADALAEQGTVASGRLYPARTIDGEAVVCAPDVVAVAITFSTEE